MIGLFKPRVALKNFQFEAPAADEDKKLVDNLMRIYGVRNLSMGTTGLIIAYFGDRKSLAWMFITGSIVAIVDGFVSKAQIGRGEWNHWGFVSISLGLGSALLGAFDRT